MSRSSAAACGPSGRFLLSSLVGHGVEILGVIDVQGSSVTAGAEIEFGSTSPVPVPVPASPAASPVGDKMDDLFGDDLADEDDLFGDKLFRDDGAETTVKDNDGDEGAKAAVKDDGGDDDDLFGGGVPSPLANPPAHTFPTPAFDVHAGLTLPIPSPLPAPPPSPAGLPPPTLRPPLRDPTPPTALPNPSPCKPCVGLTLPTVCPSRTQQPVHPPVSAARTKPAGPAQSGPPPPPFQPAGAQHSSHNGLTSTTCLSWSSAPIPPTSAANLTLAERWYSRTQPLAPAPFAAPPSGPSHEQKPAVCETIASILAARAVKQTFPSFHDPRSWPPPPKISYFQRTLAPALPAIPPQAAPRAARPLPACPPVVPPTRSSSAPPPGNYRTVLIRPAATSKPKGIKKTRPKTSLLKKALLTSAHQAGLRRPQKPGQAAVPPPTKRRTTRPPPIPTTVPAPPTAANNNKNNNHVPTPDPNPNPNTTAAQIAATNTALFQKLAALRKKQAALLRAKRAADQREQQQNIKTAQLRKIKIEQDEQSSPAAVAERRKRMTPRERFDAEMERAVRRWRVLEAVRFGEVGRLWWRMMGMMRRGRRRMWRWLMLGSFEGVGFGGGGAVVGTVRDREVEMVLLDG